METLGVGKSARFMEKTRGGEDFYRRIVPKENSKGFGGGNPETEGGDFKAYFKDCFPNHSSKKVGSAYSRGAPANPGKSRRGLIRKGFFHEHAKSLFSCKQAMFSWEIKQTAGRHASGPIRCSRKKFSRWGILFFRILPLSDAGQKGMLRFPFGAFPPNIPHAPQGAIFSPADGGNLQISASAASLIVGSEH